MKPFNLHSTLAELLQAKDETIYRNSMSILKRLQKITDEIDEERPITYCETCGVELNKKEVVKCNYCTNH